MQASMAVIRGEERSEAEPKQKVKKINEKETSLYNDMHNIVYSVLCCFYQLGSVAQIFRDTIKKQEHKS